MKVLILSVFCSCFVLHSCYVVRYDYPNPVIPPQGKNRNVCHDLRDKILVYGIFADNPPTERWSAFDVQCMMDSVGAACNWLRDQAHERNIDCQFELIFHQQKGIYPILAPQPKDGLCKLLTPNRKTGKLPIDPWSDKLCAIAGKSLPPDTSKMIHSKLIVNNRENLIDRLRDVYQTDRVVLLIFMNNFYRQKRSVSIYTENELRTEFAVICSKQPAVIAHEILHLFGATDLYAEYRSSTVIGYNNRGYDYIGLASTYPNEIMLIQHKPLSQLQISPISEYLIGWRNNLDRCASRLVFGNQSIPEF